jgi:hypothetical protein
MAKNTFKVLLMHLKREKVMSKNSKKTSKRKKAIQPIQTKKVKGKNLKPGDAIVQPHPGIVIKVDPKGKDPFWDIPNISFMDAYDCAYGGLSGPLKINDLYEILVDRKDIIKMFEKIDYQLLEHIHDTMDRRKKFKKIFRRKLDSTFLKDRKSRKKKNLKGD